MNKKTNSVNEKIQKDPIQLMQHKLLRNYNNENIFYYFFRHISCKTDIQKIILCCCHDTPAPKILCILDQSLHAVSGSFITLKKQEKYRRMCSII